MLLYVVWAHFDVPDASFKGGRLREAVSVIGDRAELVN